MFTSQQMDFLPIWFILILMMLLLFLSFWAGLRLGKYAQVRWADQSADLSLITGASLSFLALLLAFVINYAIGVIYRKKTARRLGDQCHWHGLPAGRYSAGAYQDKSRKLYVSMLPCAWKASVNGKTRTAIARSEADPGPTVESGRRAGQGQSHPNHESLSFRIERSHRPAHRTAQCRDGFSASTAHPFRSDGRVLSDHGTRGGHRQLSRAPQPDSPDRAGGDPARLHFC